MKILISGICGFVGSSVAHGLLEHDSALELIGLDNLSRAGSHLNIEALKHDTEKKGETSAEFAKMATSGP